MLYRNWSKCILWLNMLVLKLRNIWWCSLRDIPSFQNLSQLWIKYSKLNSRQEGILLLLRKEYTCLKSCTLNIEKWAFHAILKKLWQLGESTGDQNYAHYSWVGGELKLCKLYEGAKQLTFILGMECCKFSEVWKFTQILVILFSENISLWSNSWKSFMIKIFEDCNGYRAPLLLDFVVKPLEMKKHTNKQKKHINKADNCGSEAHN